MGRGHEKKTAKGRLDKYYRLAKDQGFRSRAAFKLIQLNRKFNFLGEANVCLDLCAAPGSWLQVACKFMPVTRIIVGIDLNPITQIPNVHSLQCDITTPRCRQEIKKIFRGSKADVVLHDGAPNMGTAWIHDAYIQNELTLAACKLACEFLEKGGTFVTKVFRSQNYNHLMWVFNKLFAKVNATKPAASRNVSAEIFVVCQGFLAPKKIDPRLLDPKWVFKEFEEGDSVVNIFAKKQPRRNRNGYHETSSGILARSASILEFIESEDPVTVLGTYNSLEFKPLDEDDDDELITMYALHSDTTLEVKECLKDLKVLNQKDFRGLLKWRKKMIEFSKVDEVEEAQEVELTEEEKEKLLLQEMDDTLERIRLRERRKKKREVKRRKQKEKFAMREGLGGSRIEDEFEAPTEDGLFNLQTIKTQNALKQIMGIKAEDIEQEEEESTPKITFGPMERDDFDRNQEQYFDLLYDQYLQANATFRKKLSKTARRENNKVKVEMPEKLTNFEKFQEEWSDDGGIESSDEEENELVLNPLKPGESVEAKMFFDQGMFDIVDEEDDELMDVVSKKVESALKRKLDEEDKNLPQKKKRKVDDDNLSESAEMSSSSEEEAKDEDHQFEVVPMQVDFSYDSDEQAEILAMGKKMQTPAGRAEILDKSVNKYAFDDSGVKLPDWFTDDESNHNVPNVPVTKEEVQEYKNYLKGIDSRSTKKVAEAKARKKKRAVKNLEDARKKAKQVVGSADMSEREKIKQIQKLYKNTGKLAKPEKVYVVSKKFTGNKLSGGNVRIKLVDPRMKADKRGRAARDRKSKKRRKKRRR
eukprot:TRINITY_DN12183_c0_g1_i1.p1 TRINITY_DN12183_c0_g1~~TRINITY_DN12183_c0_g1_i1.p1  ORF type:complete len:813 (-),score=260.76 TRINITY_DN12183_c0_g1_i1:1846-4284(-)